MLPERLFARAEGVVQQRSDARSQSVSFQVVVKQVVAILAVEADLNSVRLTTIFTKDLLHPIAEVSLHFEDESSRTLIGVGRVGNVANES